MWVGDRSLVHTDVIIITEIQGFFLGEPSVVVSDDRVMDPKMGNDVLDEFHAFLGANFSQMLCLDPLSEFIDCDEQMGQAPRRLLEVSQELQAPHNE
jgi:hypothetical protein